MIQKRIEQLQKEIEVAENNLLLNVKEMSTDTFTKATKNTMNEVAPLSIMSVYPLIKNIIGLVGPGRLSIFKIITTIVSARKLIASLK